MLRDPASGNVVGDSFDISNSTRTGLDYKSPNKDTAFFAPLTSNKGSKNKKYAKFNLQVDATFSAYIVLYAYFLLIKPDTAEAAKALVMKRAHLNPWEDLNMQGEARKGLKAGFKEALNSLAQLFMIHGSGP